MSVELMILIWFSMGFISWCVVVCTHGEIKVEDIFILPFGILLGFVAVLVIVIVVSKDMLENHGDKVIFTFKHKRRQNEKIVNQ